jgi:2-C-methyl-D-erythritol 4-phosphate cytidylyltransferase
MGRGRFARIPAAERIVLVAAADRVARYDPRPWLPDRVTAVVAGGPRRQESVAAGPMAQGQCASATGVPSRPTHLGPVVLVHDGARPAVSPDLILRVAVRPTVTGAAVPVVPVTETIKEVDGDRIVRTIDRSGSPRRRRHRASGTRCSSARGSIRARRHGGMDRRRSPARGLYHHRHAISGDPATSR